MTIETTATDAVETVSGTAATVAPASAATTTEASTTDAQTQAAAVAAAVASAPAIAPAPPTFDLTLRQWALEQSSRDRRVALLNGFVHTETQARHFKDTPENFAARYAAFANKPLN